MAAFPNGADGYLMCSFKLMIGGTNIEISLSKGLLAQLESGIFREAHE